jgi:hypothetical protein
MIIHPFWSKQMGWANSILIWLSSVEVKIAAAVTGHESAPLHKVEAKAPSNSFA